MADLVIFHSALGLRPGITHLADQLRDHGHTVHTPDLYAGEVFDDLTAGAAHRDRIGIPTLLSRARETVAALPDQLVYAGFSMGAAPAQMLAATRPGARGALLIQGGLPLDTLGLDSWPGDVPVQLHVAADDPWFDRHHARHVTATLPDDLIDYREYPTDAHLFADRDWHDHDPAATATMLDAITTWLAAC